MPQCDQCKPMSHNWTRILQVEYIWVESTHFHSQTRKSSCLQTTTMQPCLILLNGYPGVGKLTIAKLIHSALDAQHTIFLHNHLLIDPAEIIIPGRTPAYYEFRKRLRNLAFDALVANPDTNITILMTSCMGSIEREVENLHEHLRIGRERGIPVYWINVVCNQTQHISRISSEERKRGGTSKWTDPGLLDELAAQGIRLLNSGDIADGYQATVKFRELDSTAKTPEESSQAILEWISSL
jgi:hypothetical protein